MGIGPWEIAVLLIVLAVILGVGRLSQVGSAVGTSVREFRSAVKDQPAAPRPVVVAPPVICGACQASNPATNRFCSTCGATLGAPAPAPPPAPSTATPSEAAQAQPAGGVGAPAVVDAEHAVPPPSGAPLVADAEHPAPTSMAPGGTPTNTCPSCATINPPGQPFCGQCGTRLGTAAA